jgi:hydroxymethylbilane synthase
MTKRAKLRLGTRGSELARTQSGTVAASLAKAGFDVELTIIRTSGDTNPLFGSIGPQGVFVREIEQALVERRIDLAVHSFKDLPTSSPAELVVAAVPARVDPADLLLVRGALAAAACCCRWLLVRASAQPRRAGGCGLRTFALT